MREQTGRNRKGFMAQLGGGRAGFSLWRGWLWLWLACGMVLPALTQERPDIVWIRGGHAHWMSWSVVVFAGWAFAGVGECG
jgi:hypothetical protein